MDGEVIRSEEEQKELEAKELEKEKAEKETESKEAEKENDKSEPYGYDNEVYVKHQSHSCKNCGATLRFLPNHELVCEKCMKTYDIEYVAPGGKHPLEFSAEKSDEYRSWVNNNKVFKCENCGSNVILNKLEISKECPYCGSNVVSETRKLPGLLPDAIIPFQFSKKIAVQHLINEAKKRFFVSGKFKKDGTKTFVTGIYVPAFNFDKDTETKYRAKISEIRASGKHISTNIYTIKGTYRCKFKDIYVESSSKISQKDLNGVLPFKTVDAVKFDESYILGYTVENYNNGLKNCNLIVNDIMRDKIKQGIIRRRCPINSSVVEYHAQTTFSNEHFAYTLVPVYRFEYKFSNKTYVTYMNGQTGKVDKNLPKSVLKIAITILASVFVIGLLVIILMIYDVNLI